MLNNTEKAKWIAELNNLDGTVLLKCDVHNFFPGHPNSEAKMGCPDCAYAELFHQVATTPPHKRAELVDQMERAIHHLCEDLDRGETFQIFDHPEISYERDVN